MGRVNKPSDPFTPDPVARLLSRGLEHYGRDEIDEAIRCWRQVLELDPKHPVARDYLESAGISVEVAQQAEIIDFDAARAQLATQHAHEPAPEPHDPPFEQEELEELLRQRRYEDALRRLYLARARRPDDPSISRSIGLLRDRLVMDYASRLGNLDRVPSVTPGGHVNALTTEERHVLSLVDGVSSYGDIVAASTVGRLPTLRVLCTFLERGTITAEPPGPPTTRSGMHPRQAVNGEGRERWTIPPRSDSNAPPPVTQRPPERPPVSSMLIADNRVEDPKEDDGYGALFQRATEAYLVRDFDLAVALFTECTRKRPEDPRPYHNLKALKRRIGKT